MVDPRQEVSEPKKVTEEVNQESEENATKSPARDSEVKKGTPVTLGSFVFGDMPPEAKKVIKEEEKSLKGWILSTLTGIIKFLGIHRLLSYLGFPMITSVEQDKEGDGEDGTEDNSNKRKHKELELEEDADDTIDKVEKDAKKWRPDSAYVSIQLFIRKMFGAPDPNGNLERDPACDDTDRQGDQHLPEDGAGMNWNLEPDCNFVSKDQDAQLPFTSPNKTEDKKIHDENLNKFESQSTVQNSD